MRVGLVITCALLSGAAQTTAQEIRGRVVDDATRQGLVNATVLLTTPDSAVVQRVGTDSKGFFRLKPKNAGQYAITVELLGYARERREVVFDGQDSTVPAFVLRVEAVPVKPVEATATAESKTDKPAGFSRSSMVVAGSKMATLEEAGTPFKSAVRETGSLEVKEYQTPQGLVICIQATRRAATFSAPAGRCAWPAIVLDGVLLSPSDVQNIVRGLQIAELESIEFLPPVEAGQRYGLAASANGGRAAVDLTEIPHVTGSNFRKQ
jgi:hypothetical protein